MYVSAKSKDELYVSIAVVVAIRKFMSIFKSKATMVKIRI